MLLPACDKPGGHAPRRRGPPEELANVAWAWDVSDDGARLKSFLEAGARAADSPAGASLLACRCVSSGHRGQFQDIDIHVICLDSQMSG